MNCKVCKGCGKCARHFPVPIVKAGAATLPVLVPRKGLGAAVDIGSTTIVVRVYDLTTGELFGQRACLNPQRQVSSDVMGRISAAMEGRLEELRDSVRAVVWDSIGGKEVAEAVVVGNTTMLHLFAGVSPSSYATAPFAADRLFGERLAIGGVDVRLPRCVHGFFGADAVAAVRMSGMCSRGGCELLVDIGTNGEIALWNGSRLSVTSVAAGPAFECLDVSGSEIIAAIADGLDEGAIEDTGRVVGKLRSGIAQSDVRAVQLAKAAVFAGIETILAKTGTPLASITRFSLAGGLGTGLDPVKAARIGLFSEELVPVARVCGNLAIEGAAAELLDPPFGEETDRLVASARYVELGGDAEFGAAFVAAMKFLPRRNPQPPMPSEKPRRDFKGRQVKHKHHGQISERKEHAERD